MTRDRPVDGACREGVEAIRLLFFTLFAGLEQLHRLCRHHGRDRVLVDQLRMRIAPQQHTEVVEPGDDALSFTPLTRKTVTGVLFLRTWFRKTSWTFWDFSLDIAGSFFLGAAPRLGHASSAGGSPASGHT